VAGRARKRGGLGSLGEGGLEGFGDELPEVAGSRDSRGEAGIHGELLATGGGDIEPGDVDRGILDFGLAIFDWKGGGEGEQRLDVGNAEGDRAMGRTTRSRGISVERR
jgi:hypothetical protein